MLSHDVLVTVLVLAPLVGFFINGLRFRSSHGVLAGSIATAAAVISFACTLALFFKLMALPATDRIFNTHYFDWMTIGNFTARAAFTVDSVSILMLLVITGVGSLIHLFSVGYMSHDERPAKYFAYLNLFLFNMLLLVLGDNLLVMFVGWEGVGLCSYLLIGFWFTDPEKAAAGMKAFVTNRIGDAGFLLGIFMLFLYAGTVDFAELAARMPATAEVGWLGPITLACLFLFIGATGKSAQIPLYVWLPDAMAGPTPVSALIHAATMVTAGVYMIVRMNVVFMMAPNAMAVIAVVGALTAVLAATIGLTQWDIKKILAYSTVSQLGYMFLGVGVGAFMPALFHLITHAFFKALMFLGSGSVIHAMDGEQDVRKMGALKKYLPITHLTFFIGWLAIIGAPPFAGFFSKDEILWFAFSSPQGHPALWVLGVFGAGCTAFYMTRLMALTFWGKSRVPASVHPHESPWTMTVPLIVLAVLSLVGGWIGIPHVMGEVLPGHPGHWLEHWTSGVIRGAVIEHPSAIVEWSLMGISVGVAGMLAGLAFHFYVQAPEKPGRLVAKIEPVYRCVANKYGVDEFYANTIINPLIQFSRGVWMFLDVGFIDKMTYWVADWVQQVGTGLRAIQNGNLQRYATLIALGVAVALILIQQG